MIAKQPPEQREWHLQHIAGFLQQPNVMAEAYDTVERELRTQVALLDKAGRVEEVARMLGGETITPRIRSTAAEMLKQK